MKTNPAYYLVLLAILFACNPSSPQQEKPKAVTYTSKEIGWTVEIPAGFKLISEAKIESNDQKGKEAIGKVYEGEVSMARLKHLVSFQKNQFNLFDSTIEPYAESKPGAYEANNKLIKQLIFDTYTNQKIKIDTSSAKETVQGKAFHAFYIKVYGPSGAVLMNQVMYGTVINGFDFGVNINYDNETDKKLLINAFKNSRFVQHH